MSKTFMNHLYGISILTKIVIVISMTSTLVINVNVNIVIYMNTQIITNCLDLLHVLQKIANIVNL
jgi:hypothetical protein